MEPMAVAVANAEMADQVPFQVRVSVGLSVKLYCGESGASTRVNPTGLMAASVGMSIVHQAGAASVGGEFLDGLGGAFRRLRRAPREVHHRV